MTLPQPESLYGDTLVVGLSESRYDRQERVTWWDQRRLADARIVVVGAGALGNEVVKNLALVGVGSIVVIDHDTVEASNLARCVFFRGSDEGRPKAVALAERAAELNPDVDVQGIVADIRSFGTGLTLRTDAFVGALDNREARLYCNRLAARTRRPWVDGAIEALSGLARVFQPPEVCYECTLTDADWEALAHRQSCRLLSLEELATGKVPTTASTSSVIGGLQAQEVIKLLHRDVPGVRPLTGAIVFDGINNDAYPLRYPTDDLCQAHHHFDDPVALEGVTESSAADVAAACWPDADGATLVVDLGDDHLVSWNCPDCNVITPDARPVALVGFGEARCPACEQPRQPEILNSVAVPGPFSDRPLRDLGVRTDEIIAVRKGVDERYCWLTRLDDRLPESWREANGVATLRPEGEA